MKNKLFFIFSLMLSFAILSPSTLTFAQGTYEVHNNLNYPVTVDLYRIYWERDLATNPVYIETIKLAPKQTHTCDFTQTNDQSIKSYQYRIQCSTSYYAKEVNSVFNTTKTATSSIMQPANQCRGWYKFPSIF